MTEDRDALVEVTREDRLRADELFKDAPGFPLTAKLHAIVSEAFARCRQSSESAEVERHVAAIVAAVAAWKSPILPPTTSAGDGELIERLRGFAELPAAQVAPDIKRALHQAATRVKELEEALTKIDRIGRTNRGPGVRIAQMQETAQAALTAWNSIGADRED